MSKLVLVLCLFSITALAKPSNSESDENTVECQMIRVSLKEDKIADRLEM